MKYFNKIVENIKNLQKLVRMTIQRLLSYLPSNLPVGMAEFEKFTDSIVSLIGEGLEKVPRDDLQFMIAGEIMRLAPQTNKVPKRYFIKTIRKYAANQVAGQIFVNIKEKQKAEATAAAGQASNGQEKAN